MGMAVGTYFMQSQPLFISCVDRNIIDEMAVDGTASRRCTIHFSTLTAQLHRSEIIQSKLFVLSFTIQEQ